MNARHHMTLDSTCPVNGDPDRYDVFAYVRGRVLPCEELVQAVEALTKDPVFQEELTQQLADRLGVRVKTVGTHVRGRVSTTVVCRPRAGARGECHAQAAPAAAGTRLLPAAVPAVRPQAG